MEFASWITSGPGEDELARRVRRALHRGRRVLVVVADSVAGANLRLALDALVDPQNPVSLLHESAPVAEYRRAIDNFSGRHPELEVLVQARSTAGRCAPTHHRLELVARHPDLAAVTCAVASDAVVPGSIGHLLDHDAVERGGQRVSTRGRERFLAAEVIVGALAPDSDALELREALGSLHLSGTEVAELCAQFHQRQEQWRRAESLQAEIDDLRRQVALGEAAVAGYERCLVALRCADGEIGAALREAATVTGHDLLVEDDRFRPLFWSSEGPTPPPSLARALGPLRAERAVADLRPGVPEPVRLGQPVQGTRIILRLGADTRRGYLSALGCEPSPRTDLRATLLGLEGPLLTALRVRAAQRAVSEGMGSLLIRTVCDDDHTDDERLDAAELLGWAGDGPRRVLFLQPPPGPPGAHHRLLTGVVRDARTAGLALGVLRDGLAGVVAWSDTDSLGWAASHSDADGLVLGTSDVLSLGILGVPPAVRRARWAASVARTNGRATARFEALGIDRLLFPGPPGDIDHLTAPLHRLRDAAEVLEFDPTETLRCWFANGSNVRATAAAMFIHPNSLRYRLERIAATTGIDTSDHDAMFELELALRIESSRQARASFTEGGDLPKG